VAVYIVDCNVDERALKQIAQKLIDTGLAKKGYRYGERL